MKSIIIALTGIVVFFSSAAMAEIECKATKKIITKTETKTITVKLTPTSYGSKLKVFRGDLQLFHFSVRDDYSGSLLAMITEGPDYTRGTTLNSGLDMDGKIKMSIVRGNTVHFLTCQEI